MNGSKTPVMPVREKARFINHERSSSSSSFCSHISRLKRASRMMVARNWPAKSTPIATVALAASAPLEPCPAPGSARLMRRTLRTRMLRWNDIENDMIP
jgi:hypothetical protein